MMKQILITISFFIVISLCGCTFTKNSDCDVTNIFLAGAGYQHEQDVLLTASRYISLYGLANETNNINLMKKLDWYIDLMIMELETNYQNRNELSQVSIEKINKVKNKIKPYRPERLSNEFIGKKIAEHRIKTPRIHGRQLGQEEMKLIESFLNRYE